MKVYNKWVGYLDRNYQEIKRKVLDRLGESVPEITDHSESNILVIIVGIFSGVAEMLNYYIDNMAREAFITTARKYSSVVKLTRLIDYRIKAMIPASVDIEVKFLNNDNTPFVTTTEIILAPGLQFTTSNGTSFISTQNIIIPVGSTSISFPVSQKTVSLNNLIGYTTSDPEQAFSLGFDYVNGSASLKIDTTPWNYQETLGRSKPTDTDFIVDISASKEAYVRFGDNINGMMPVAGQPIYVDYYKSLGSLGNVNEGTINRVPSELNTLYGIPKSTVNNLLGASAGTDYEDIERIRRSAPLSLRTLLRAVTRQDYEDIALLAPGVNKAKVKYECGKFVYLYISPNGGGISSTGLLTDVENYFENKKMVTTFVKALPVGESNIVIDMDVTTKFRRDPIQTKTDVENALLDMWSYDNSDINKPIRESDIIALVDNLEKVDYLKLNYLSVLPYMRPSGDINNNLDHTLTVNLGSTSINNWTLKYDGGYMKIFRNNQELANLVLGQTYTDPHNIITLNLGLTTYPIGSEWTFRTFPVNNDVVLDDYSIPVLKGINLNVVVTEQLSI
jgi:hypothetical protein